MPIKISNIMISGMIISFYNFKSMYLIIVLIDVYELAENTRDFSHEMNRLRIGHGLCHVNYPTYDQPKFTEKTDIII